MGGIKGLAFVLGLSCLALAFLGCHSKAPKGESASSQRDAGQEKGLTLECEAFAYGVSIPKRFSEDGANESPPLCWKVGAHIKDKVKSFALICEDPDAPGGLWIHWVIYNIPPHLSALPPKIGRKEKGEFFTQGKNSWGKVGYYGPAPPPGKPHRYFFRLYALQLPPTLPSGLTAEELRKRIQGHIVAEAHWMGTYQRTEKE